MMLPSRSLEDGTNTHTPGACPALSCLAAPGLAHHLNCLARSLNGLEILMSSQSMPLSC